DFCTQEELRQLFGQVDSCRHMLSEDGILWLDAHWAWLDDDLTKVQTLTKKYLDSRQRIVTQVDKHLLILNLASLIINDEHGYVKQYHGKIASEIANDLELRGLFNLIDATLIEKE
ncbi:MAG: hypothetical protein AB2541_11210, partial [Candidatus Thiodiazotropha sp.]